MLTEESHLDISYMKMDPYDFQKRLCVPNNVEIRKKILEEGYNSCYSIHPGGAAMCKDLRLYFWSNNMKKEIAEYVDKCLIYEKV